MALLAGVCLGLPVAAGADGVNGYLQLAYQRTQTGDAPATEFWSSSVVLDNSTNITEAVSVVSQLELRDTRYFHSLERTTVPRGSVRLIHPFYGVSGSFRPTTTVDGRGRRTEVKETVLTGYLARPGMPRFEASWIRRSRDGGSTAAASVNRMIRMTHEAGPLSIRAGYDDLAQDPSEKRFRRTTQNNFNGGLSLRMAPATTATLLVNADFTENRTRREDNSVDHLGTQSADIEGSAKMSARTDMSLNYTFRRTQATRQSEGVLNDHDGTLLLNYRPFGRVRFSAGGGIRTSRTAGKTELLKNTLVLASVNGTVRGGWKGVATASYQRNWFPGGRAFDVQSYRFDSRMPIRHGIDLTTNAQVSANGDTAAAGQRIVTQAGLGFTVTPLRGMRIAWTNNVYRIGPSLTRTPQHSRSNTWLIDLQPGAGLAFTANLASTAALPKGDPRLSTQQYVIRWSSRNVFDLETNYTRSSQTRFGGITSGLAGREIVGGRLLMALGRNYRVTGSINVADPGKSSRARQFEVTVTRRFGR